ncbi:MULTISPECIES: hypothetical protein [Micromonospora]|uniref:Uncharacterized protein n=1 Tax=Micromonospora sagamiensis TaxID=47875 RepID=A0A562VM71_9ACTN|nr:MULTISPECIES: hypothetical protein [Micromonospora]TWJ19056.1 hypothetical protein JD81_05948 [Micromonospora sagamiensis]TWJ24754.1 hypothetical protein JD76_04910 [Micromonospora endolithica]
MPRERLSTLAVLPDDVTDPLLWRLAFDVASAHQPDERGDCRNLQCHGQRGMCAAARAARRAMTVSRAPQMTVPQSVPARGRAAGDGLSRRGFAGWFTVGSPAETMRRVSGPGPLPHLPAPRREVA